MAAQLRACLSEIHAWPTAPRPSRPCWAPRPGMPAKLRPVARARTSNLNIGTAARRSECPCTMKEGDELASYGSGGRTLRKRKSRRADERWAPAGSMQGRSAQSRKAVDDSDGPFCRSDEPPALDRLLAAADRSRKIIVFSGSGLSATSGARGGRAGRGRAGGVRQSASGPSDS